MSKFKVGDRVRVCGKAFGKVSKVYDTVLYDGVQIYDIELSDYYSTMVAAEKDMDRDYDKCDCGLRFARSGGKHSHWCSAKPWEDL